MLDTVLPGRRKIISRRFEDSARYLVSHDGETASERRIPLFVSNHHLANLGFAIYLDLDSSGRYLKAVRADYVIESVLDRKPLFRYEYRSDMHTDPVAHWQVHAERGAISHLLSHAHLRNPKLIAKPHDMASLHFPVGGERFRPCLEDVLEFLVMECGIDAGPNWRAAVESGRQGWRRRQLQTVVRDAQEEAAQTLRSLGWSVSPPAAGVPAEHTASFTRW